MRLKAMRRSIRLFATATVLSAAIPALALAQSLAFSPVTTVDVREGVARAGMTVVVTGDRITAVGPVNEIEIPAGARMIDATGKYLIPGLWDMHAHASRASRAPRFWPLLLAHGVTGMRDAGSYAESLLHWRALSESPGAVAPRIEITSPSLTGDSPPPLPGMGGPFEISVADAAAAVDVVDSLAEQGIKVIKVYDGLPREAYFAVAERTKELGMSFIGHVPLSVTLAEASDAGQKSFEHVSDVWFSCVDEGRVAFANFAWASAFHGPTSDAALAARGRLAGALASSEPDPRECGPLLERMEANGTWLTPTLTLLLGELQPRRFDADPRMRWIPDSVRERWNARPRMPAEQEAEIGRRMLTNAERAVAIAHDAGVPILAGTDASDMPYIFAGSSLHDELSLYVEAGLTPLEALRTATINPARFLGRADELGTVEEGKLADLVLLDANPLEDITNTQRIRAVVADGRYLDRQALDALLAQAEAAAKAEPAEVSPDLLELKLERPLLAVDQTGRAMASISIRSSRRQTSARRKRVGTRPPVSSASSRRASGSSTAFRR